MSASDRLARVAFFLLGAAGCARATEVELRLHPCMAPQSGPPHRVDLEVAGYDAAGKPMPPLVHGFDIPDPSVLADGYATVGLVKPDGMVEAAFTLTWSFGPDVPMARVLLPRRPVPAAGEVLELGAESCAPVGDTTGTSTSDSDASSSSSSASSSGGDSSSSTSEGTSTSTGDTSTSTGDTSTSTGSESSSSGASGASSTTGEPTMLGDDCVNTGELFCENAAPGKLGSVLYCTGTTWVEADLKMACAPLDIFCPVGELTKPVPIGCFNQGVDNFSCGCRDEPAMPCEPEKIGCVGNDHITLCTDEGQGDIRVKGLCVGLCKDDGDGPYCTPQ